MSDDSTDSIRASMSDQGQSGNKQMESRRERMRKEHSDPMLALDMQKKKHTLPDKENITKLVLQHFYVSKLPSLEVIIRAVRFAPTVAHIGLKSDKSGTFSDQLSVGQVGI